MASLGAVLERAWYNSAWWLWLLRPLEWLFRSLTAVRRFAYQQGWLRSWRAPCKVLVVGNITVGGTGKTPITVALVEHLQARGIAVGVVARGYGGTAPQYPFVVGQDSPASQCGDEPLLIRQRTGCPVVVGPSRTAAAQALLSTASLDVVISDDGLQHYALQRDFELVVSDAERGFGNGFCLPAGPLREPVSRLNNVDAVVYRGDRSQRGVMYRVGAVVNLVTGQERSLDSFTTAVVAVAGIGQPDQFFHTLSDAGLNCETHVFPDHHAFVAGDLAPFADRPVIMTEKDAVKCRPFAQASHWYLRIDAILPADLLAQVDGLLAPQES